MARRTEGGKGGEKMKREGSWGKRERPSEEYLN